MGEKLLTIADVAKHLGLSEKDVKDLVEKGELPAYKIGGSFLRFKQEQVDNFIRKRDSMKMANEALFKDRGVKHGLSSIDPHNDKWLDDGYAAARAGSQKYNFWERFIDFLYYNDFYIVSLILLIIIVLTVIEF